MTALQKSISAAQRKKDPHAGPNGSFPEDAGHIKAAWDLAGHAADPDAVRARILAYAKKHNLMGSLPQTAKKAKNSDLSGVVTDAFSATLPGSIERHALIHGLHKRTLVHHLPPEAHTDLHAMGIPHNHAPESGIVPMMGGEDEGDIQHDPDDPAYPYMHDHVITKAFNPKATYGVIVKSWTEGEDQFIEGWMSTPHRDLEKDITEPEAFADGPLTDYFARSAPLSLEHGTNTLPAGHLQKAAILRNGKVLEVALHPNDASDFNHLPTTADASGVWVRARITEEPATSAVRKGNVGGMSFIGNFTQYEPLPDGGKRYRRIDPLIESTVAAYPVNPKAAFSRVQKALGVSPDEPGESPNMDEDSILAQLLADAAERKSANEQVQKGITTDQLGDLLAQFETKLTAMVDEKVQKSQVPLREEGLGRKGSAPASTGPTIDDDPINFLIQKAQKDEELTQVEKNLAGSLFAAALKQGMVEDPE